MSSVRIPLKSLSQELFNRLEDDAEQPSTRRVRFADEVNTTAGTKSRKCGVNALAPKSYKKCSKQTHTNWSSPKKEVQPHMPPRRNVAGSLAKRMKRPGQDPKNIHENPLSKILTSNDPDNISTSSTSVVCEATLSSELSFEIANDDEMVDDNIIHASDSIDGVMRVNFFSLIYAVLQELVPTKALLVLSSHRGPSNQDAGQMAVSPTTTHSTHVKQSSNTSGDINALEHILKGLDAAEAEVNLDSVFVFDLGLLKKYYDVKVDLVRELLPECLTSSHMSSMFSSHWAFIGLLIVDAIVQHAVFSLSYCEGLCPGQALSPLAMWEYNFEMTAARMLGGEEKAASTLSMRALMLLREHFDIDSYDH